MPLELKPVATERVSDVIAERLMEAIQDGTLQPGDRLPTEAELARDFKVGRTSVREGLQKLRAHGLIESRKGLGAFVLVPPAPEAPPVDLASGSAIEQLVEARVGLETFAAALASLRASEDELDALEGLHAEHVAAEGKPALVATDQAFHAAILAAARNPFLSGAYALLMAELSEFVERTFVPWTKDRSVDGHSAILRALRAHDPLQARRAMSDHVWMRHAEMAAAAGGRPQGLPLPPREMIV